MPTADNEISRSEPGRGNEQLSGRVWLAQNRAEWPVYLYMSEHHVIAHLRQHRDAAVWEYEITPVRRVAMAEPPPYLEPA